MNNLLTTFNKLLLIGLSIIEYITDSCEKLNFLKMFSTIFVDLICCHIIGISRMYVHTGIRYLHCYFMKLFILLLNAKEKVILCMKKCCSNWKVILNKL